MLHNLVMPEETLAFQVIVSGRVQGVFFRSSMKQVAEENNVVGWVRNLKDGRVESFVQGRKSEVDKILEWCRSGPAGAQVDDVSATPIREQPLRNFTILY